LLPFFQASLVRAWQDRSRRSIENKLCEMEKPDYLEHQKALAWQWVSLTLYLIACYLFFFTVRDLVPDLPCRFMECVTALGAALCARLAASSGKMIDPRKFAERREILKNKLQLKQTPP
jgi:hypothetical protein